jgi:hypothetical protein
MVGFKLQINAQDEGFQKYTLKCINNYTVHQGWQHMNWKSVQCSEASTEELI